MSPILIFIIIILGCTIGIITFLVLRSVLAPKRISTLSALVKSGKAGVAIKSAKAILTKDPRNPEAHYFLGLAYLADNKPELALMELKTVNQMGVFQGLLVEKEFRKKIAELYLRFEQDEEALKEYLLLIKFEPDVPEYYFKAGQIFEERNKADQAHKFYRKCIDLDPRNSDAHLKLGMLFFRANRPNEARQELEHALQLAPENYNAYFFLGRLLKESHDFNGALSAFEKSTKDPELKLKALVERGSCFLAQKNYERAIIELERAIKLSPDDTDKEMLFARYFLAHCYEKTRNIERAITEWEKIYSKKPTFKDVAEKLAAYQDLRIDDKIKDYVTSQKQKFMEICQKIASTMGFSVQSCEEIPGGAVRIVCIENESEKWRNVKKMPKLMQFYRTSSNIDEAPLREVVDEIRRLGANKCYMVTNTAFTRAAQTFAETRPYELLGKDQLQDLLKRTEI
ncbi:MAG: tetratricopeptide repeat protein [Spirochaetales bacterium]|nr:tetratricopeptide repeat protein [Spirochaetales bacterium]